MNHQLYIPIANFTVLTKDKLAAFADELQLQMPFDALLYCQQQYLLSKKRSPSAKELQMLDRLVCEALSETQYQTVSELYTDEEPIAATYRDMMERRRLLSPNADTPPSFGELATLGRRHLDGTVLRAEQQLYAASGKSARRKAAAKRKARNYEDDTASIGIGYVSPAVCREPVAVGDTVYAVLGSDHTAEDFERKLDLFLDSNAVVGWVKEILPLNSQSPLLRLLELGKSFTFPHFDITESADLLSLTEGALLITDAPKAAELLMVAHDLSLRVRKLGRVEKDGGLCLSFPTGESVSFPLPFLHNLLYASSCTVELGRGAPEDTQLQLSPTGTFTHEDKTYCITKVAADGSSAFHAALYTAIGSMSAAVANGADPSAFTVMAELAAPKDRQDPLSLGTTMGAILGLYRAEAEFSLYNASVSFHRSKNAKAITLWTMAPVERPIPDAVSGGGSMIFYLEPTYGENGLPDFSSVRKLHAYLYGLHRDGLILSAHAASGDILKTLGKMSVGAEMEYLRNERIVAKLGGILVETRTQIDGLLVARTAPEPAEKKSEKEDSLT